MKKLLSLTLILSVIFLLTTAESCVQKPNTKNTAALEEQQHTEQNQSRLNKVQPAPFIGWSLERDNLIKRFVLQNDRSVTMYMYVFIEGVGTPIGYYIVNKVSSVNSQLTNPAQIVQKHDYQSVALASLPSPAEDGSYGTNGDAVFGFTPDGLYMEHNMKYIVATAPLAFKNVPMIGEISVDIKKILQTKLELIEKEYNKGM